MAWLNAENGGIEWVMRDKMIRLMTKEIKGLKLRIYLNRITC